jgi:hypothetical protein
MTFSAVLGNLSVAQLVHELPVTLPVNYYRVHNGLTMELSKMTTFYTLSSDVP